MAALKIGDRVQYRTAFLRSIGAYAGDLPHARGTIEAIRTLGGSTSIATVAWGGTPEGIPTNVNAANLQRCPR